MDFHKKEDKERAIILVIGLFMVGSIVTFALFSERFQTVGMGQYIPGPETLAVQVQEFPLNLPVQPAVGDGNHICVIIRIDSEEVLSYNLDRTGKSGWKATLSDDFFCDSQENEDLIIKYNSYADFAEHFFHPTCRNLKNTHTEGYYVLPSRLVKEGGEVICDEEFRQEYCPAVMECLTDEEADQLELGCCLDQAGSAMQAQTEMAKTGQAAVPPSEAEQQETGIITGALGSGGTFFLLLLALIVVSGGVFVNLKLRNKNRSEDRRSEKKRSSKQPAKQDHDSQPTLRHPSFGISIVPARPIQGQGSRQQAGQLGNQPQSPAGRSPAQRSPAQRFPGNISSHPAGEHPKMREMKQYIQERLAQKVPPQQVRQELISSGWQPGIIDRYL
ncbi:hypothetical protein GF351_06365 [Candidatus Woesearchaeota archaeon]|nr:hypothetical protein [Candidatus Woesearchaeota archaeon]